MEPNYNFENEISEQYGLIAFQYREIAKTLLNKYKVINNKEFDIIMWQACNLKGGSLIRKELLTTLKKLETEARAKKVGYWQTKINY